MKRKSDLSGGCAIAFFAGWCLFALAWIGFIVWAVYSVVSWLVTK